MVVPTYERPSDLRKCLDSLRLDNQGEQVNYELIVTDDSKSDRCRKLVETKFPEISWGKGKQNGPAGNRNAGVKRAKGEWIVFVDDDCIADKKFLNSYHKAIEDYPNTILFEGKIYPDRPRKTWAECCPENSNGNMFWTSNLCVKKEVFNQVGGFDESFRVAYEDIDFAYRVNSLGLQSKFVSEASVCHPWRTLKHEGNNWKPLGFEWMELELFIKKHPEAHEHSSPSIYARHFLRMITKDLYECLKKFRGRGLSVLMGQTFVTFCIILRLIKIKGIA